MIHKQGSTPLNAKTGDAWTDDVSFKRVLSRGGAWENVNLGAKHPDEVDHEQEQRTEAEQRNDGSEVSGRAGESAPGDGNYREGSEFAGLGQENTGVVGGLSTLENPESTDPVHVQPDGSVTREPVPAGHETNPDVSADGEPLTSTGSIEGEGENRAETEAAREGVDSGPDRVV